jgi:pimeloyl-ACP methyl ester carboxylesterase
MSPDVTERTVETPDGRILAVQESGDPAGKPVLVHMGTPNSRHLYGPTKADAAAHGLRLISYDRPGYGGSTAQPGRSHADCAADVRTIATALGIERLGIWGISGGGAHALACAALLPDLAAGVASLAGLAPYGAEDLDWFDGMGKENADDFREHATDKAAARKKTDRDWEEAMATTAGQIAEQFPTLLSPVDATVLTGELAEYLAFSEHEGLAPGSEGWWEDGEAQVGPWGFELGDISVPVLIVHGRHDKFVPFGHGEWLAARIPGAEAWLLDDDGHLTLMERRVPEVHAWLAERL